MVHSITRFCSRTVRYQPGVCGCGSSTPDLPAAKNNWIWRGCFDNVTFAQGIVKQLLNEPATDTDLLSTVIRHNFQLGREMVQKKTLRKCRCHGMSGSCFMKTCWLEIPPLQRIAHRIKKLYKNATRFGSDTTNNAVRLNNRAHQAFSVNLTSLESLAYIDKSPNYCKADKSANIDGTKGRICSKNITKGVGKSERDSCKNLCTSCHYTIRMMTDFVPYRCKCSFHMDKNASVICDQCFKFVIKYFCD